MQLMVVVEAPIMEVALLRTTAATDKLGQIGIHCNLYL